MAGPLEGIRILEFSEIIAAPFAGMLLTDMGADSIKVEPPWGEPWRLMRTFMPLESRTFISLNRGKRSLPLDMTKKEAREIVYKLVPQMDVVIVNYRPDVSYNLGIDYETLSAMNPRLIYCDNTAFGRKGPHSYRPGYDLIAQAITGLMAAEGKVRNGVPQELVSVPIADFATGIAMAWGICASLYVRERTGRGQKLEATLLASALTVQTGRFLLVESAEGKARAALLEDINELRNAGVPYQQVRDHYQAAVGRPVNAYYRTYQTKDGVVAVGCLSDSLRKKLLGVLALHDIRFDPGYNPNSPETKAFDEELARKAEALFVEKTTEEWLAILDKAGVPAGPLRFTEELMDDEQVRANDLVVELDHAKAGRIKMVGPMLKMSETPLKARSASPALGQHTEEILTGLGYTLQDIQRLRELGVTR